MLHRLYLSLLWLLMGCAVLVVGATVAIQAHDHMVVKEDRECFLAAKARSEAKEKEIWGKSTTEPVSAADGLGAIPDKTQATRAPSFDAIEGEEVPPTRSAEPHRNSRSTPLPEPVLARDKDAVDSTDVPGQKKLERVLSREEVWELGLEERPPVQQCKVVRYSTGRDGEWDMAEHFSSRAWMKTSLGSAWSTGEVAASFLAFVPAILLVLLRRWWRWVRLGSAA